MFTLVGHFIFFPAFGYWRRRMLLNLLWASDVIHADVLSKGVRKTNKILDIFEQNGCLICRLVCLYVPLLLAYSESRF